MTLSRRGAVRVLALGADRPPVWDSSAHGSVWSTARINSTESPAGNRADSNRCVAPLPQTAPEPRVEGDRRLEEIGELQTQKRFIGPDVHRKVRHCRGCCWWSGTY